MTLSEAQYQNYIITSLLVAETCPPADFTAHVGVLWDLMRPLSGCDLELQYLLTRQQALKLLMGCYTRQIDTRSGRSEQHQRSRSTSRADGWAQAANTMASIAFADAVGENRYRDIATGSADSASDRQAWSNSHDESHNRFSDTGSGASQADSTQTRTAHSRRVGAEENNSQGSSTSRGQRGGCNYSFSQSATDGTGLNLILVGAGRTGSKNTWDQYIADASSSTDWTQSASVGQRTNTAQSTANARSQRTSSSYYNALADGHDWSTSQSHAEDHATGSRDALAHSDGAGTGNHEGKDRAEMSSQASSLAHDDSEAHSQATRTGFSVLDDIKAHQRFEHLRQLYDNTTLLIALKRDRLRKRAGVVAFGELLTCTMDGFCRVC